MRRKTSKRAGLRGELTGWLDAKSSVKDLGTAKQRLDKLLSEHKATGRYDCGHISALLKQNRLYVAAQIAYRQMPAPWKKTAQGKNYLDAVSRWGVHIEHYNNEMKYACENKSSARFDEPERKMGTVHRRDRFEGDPQGFYGVRRKKRAAKRKGRR